MKSKTNKAHHQPTMGPRAYFVSVLAIIFASEMLVMFVLPWVMPNDASTVLEAACDSILLTLLSGPILYWILINPIRIFANSETLKFQRLFSAASDGIILVDHKGLILTANQSAEALFELTEDRLIGSDISRFLELEFNVDSSLFSRYQNEANRPKPIETTIYGLNGKTKHVEFTVTNIEQHGEHCYAFILRNISERKAYEEQQTKSHQFRVESARIAGKAEVATSILHNVGNTLTCINVVSNSVLDQVRDSRISRLSQAVALLQEGESDLATFLTEDKRGKQLPNYLKSLSTTLADEQNHLISELESLQQYLQHANRIVAAQQSFARCRDLEELSDVSHLVDSAIEIARASIDRHGVEIQREFDPLPMILLDRHKLIQVIVNLLTNAKDAVKENEEGNRKISVRITKNFDNYFSIAITDNGKGIADENLGKIFSQGFTTKSDGHGFGLHYCANTAKEMGGNLAAYSDGKNQGATFIIELPIKETAGALVS